MIVSPAARAPPCVDRPLPPRLRRSVSLPPRLRRPSRSTFFPYTTLFRSHRAHHRHRPAAERRGRCHCARGPACARQAVHRPRRDGRRKDRKSTRLNSSHPSISYAVFCLKKKSRAVRGREGGDDRVPGRARPPLCRPPPSTTPPSLRFSSSPSTATVKIYILSLHDALPISSCPPSAPTCR